MRITRIQLSIAAVAGILLTATALKPQIPAVGPVWEYSTVTGSATPAGRVTICYATSKGCRNEQTTGNSGHMEDAMAMAATTLGEKGWELTTATEIQNESKSERTLYFRRLQSVLNRGDSPGNR